MRLSRDKFKLLAQRATDQLVGSGNWMLRRLGVSHQSRRQSRVPLVYRGEAELMEMAVWYGPDQASDARLAELAGATGLPRIVALVAAARVLKRKAGKNVGKLRRADSERLLVALKARLPELGALSAKMHSEGAADDVYRYFHHSLKVYDAQEMTEEAVTLLQSVLPDRPLSMTLAVPVARGTGHEFDLSHNREWTTGRAHAIVTAFLLTREVLDFALKCARDMDESPTWLPSRWAAILEVYGVR